MGRIRLLPDAVINQIAAGEVVERPASVVKELLENALDAGASQVTITVKNGGKDLISVLDDGQGMDETDVRLACQRHATSKIAAAGDLEAIATLGFRGEALASIAAVSRFEIVSCADESAGGVSLGIEGGRELHSGRLGFPRGTRVSVAELFFNVPARRKFLRSATTESQHIQSVVQSLALAQPALRLRLVHNERVIWNLPACATLSERVHALLGSELEEGMLAVAGSEGALSWEGLLSLPSASRSSRRWQYLFLNGRPIRHPGLNHAVYQAYRTLLMNGRHPAYVLMLRIDPREVDVNVHPAKSEVRLRNPQWAHTVLAEKLYHAILDGSRQAAFGREAAGARLPAPAEAADGQLSLARPDLSGSGQVFDVNARAAGQGYAAAPRVRRQAWQAGAAPPATPQAAHGAAPARSAADPGSGATESRAAGAALRANPLNGDGFQFQPLAVRLGAWAEEQDSAPLGPDFTVLGQLAATYLLVQRGTGLIVIDQHAAHERILFERYRDQFYRGAPATTRFLVPETLELSPQNALLLEQYLPQWKRMGFEIESFGRDSFAVREVPALVAGKNVQALLLEVLDELALFGKSGRLEEVFNEILERVACHAAIRAGDALSREEMDALLAQLVRLDINLYCPHGRPVWVEFPARELERRFKRIV